MKIFTAVLLLCCFALPALAAPDDDDIYDKVNQRLFGDKDIHGRIKIAVKNGVVTLTGSVHDEKVKSRAEKLCKKVAGVKDVVNKLVVGDEEPPK